jgi:hypothetical protein
MCPPDPKIVASMSVLRNEADQKCGSTNYTGFRLHEQTFSRQVLSTRPWHPGWGAGGLTLTSGELSHKMKLIKIVIGVTNRSKGKSTFSQSAWSVPAFPELKLLLVDTSAVVVVAKLPVMYQKRAHCSSTSCLKAQCDIFCIALLS